MMIFLLFFLLLFQEVILEVGYSFNLIAGDDPFQSTVMYSSVNVVLCLKLFFLLRY